MDIVYKRLVQITLHRDLDQQLCQESLAHNRLQRSSQRELAESNLVSLVPEATLAMNTNTFTTRVALVLLAWSH